MLFGVSTQARFGDNAKINLNNFLCNTFAGHCSKIKLNPLKKEQILHNINLQIERTDRILENLNAIISHDAFYRE